MMETVALSLLGNHFSSLIENWIRPFSILFQFLLLKIGRLGAFGRNILLLTAKLKLLADFFAWTSSPSYTVKEDFSARVSTIANDL